MLRLLFLLLFPALVSAQTITITVRDPADNVVATHEVSTPMVYGHSSAYLRATKTDGSLLHIFPDATNYTRAMCEVGPAPTTSIPSPKPAFLEIDGRWYQAAQFAALFPGEYDVGLTTAINCRLPSGPLPANPPHPFVVVDSVPIRLDSTVKIYMHWLSTGYAVRLLTVHGNVICDNETAAPAGFGQLFTFTIFANGFE